MILLQTIDGLWKDHLLIMDHLKEGVGLSGYAQQNPLNVYKKEGFEKFKLLKHEIADQVTNLLFKVEIGAQQMAAPRFAPPPRQLPLRPPAGRN